MGPHFSGKICRLKGGKKILYLLRQQCFFGEPFPRIGLPCNSAGSVASLAKTSPPPFDILSTMLFSDS